MPDIELPVKPKVETDVLTAIDSWTLEDQHVYVHCYYKNELPEMLIRVWRSTFLIDKVAGSRSELIHAENISFAPQWTIIKGRRVFRFLLIFQRCLKIARCLILWKIFPNRWLLCPCHQAQRVGRVSCGYSLVAGFWLLVSCKSSITDHNSLINQFEPLRHEVTKVHEVLCASLRLCALAVQNSKVTNVYLAPCSIQYSKFFPNSKLNLIRSE